MEIQVESLRAHDRVALRLHTRCITLLEGSFSGARVLAEKLLFFRYGAWPTFDGTMTGCSGFVLRVTTSPQHKTLHFYKNPVGPNQKLYEY